MTSRSTRHFTIRAVLTLRAAPAHAAAIAAVDELLSKQRIEHLFLGNVARAAWLGGVVDAGSIDVLGLMQSQQKNNVAMMAGNRGFHVDRDEVERTAELDLVPLTFEGVRVHLVVASNALYARMFGSAHVGRVLNPSVLNPSVLNPSVLNPSAEGRVENPSHIDPSDIEVRVPSAEDLALLLTMSEDEEAV